MSIESTPSHRPAVPPELAASVRCVGDLTHKKLELFGVFALVEMIVFVALLLVAYFYAWGKGIFRWD